MGSQDGRYQSMTMAGHRIHVRTEDPALRLLRHNIVLSGYPVILRAFDGRLDLSDARYNLLCMLRHGFSTEILQKRGQKKQGQGHKDCGAAYELRKR